MEHLHLSYEEFKAFYGDLGITYWTKYNYLDLDYVGKYNVWDEDWEAGRIDITTGQNAPGYGIRSKEYINIFANKEYSVEFGNYPGASVIVYFYDENKSFISYVGVPSSRKFTTISNCVFIRFAVFTSSAITYNNDIRIYQPVIDLGRLDIGSVVSERYQSGDIYVFVIDVADMKTYTTGGCVAICSGYELKQNSTNYFAVALSSDNQFTYGYNTKRYAFRNDSYITAAAFTAAMKNTFLVYVKE